MKKFKIHFVSIGPVVVEGDEMHFATDYFRIERSESRKRTVFTCPREHLLYCEVVEDG